jgi:hypothetical protein
MKNWIDKYWGWLPVIAAMAVFIPLAGSCVNRNFERNWSKEIACSQVGGVIASPDAGTGFGCYRVTVTYEPLVSKP